MNKLKVGLLGCGRIAPKHLLALRDNAQEAELVGLFDPVPEKLQEKQRLYEELTGSSVRAYGSDEELLRDPDIDLVSIATESGYHGKLALRALAEGKHLLIEKPMALSLEEMEEINALAKEKGLLVSVSHQNRFNPAVQKLRRALDEGRFGKIINITARILWNRNQDYYDQAPWRGTRALDGGTLMNQCIHNIDLLQWMMNDDVVSVKAELGTFLRDIEMEDFGALLLRFRRGSIGLVEGSACVYPTNLEETLSVFGEKGTVVIGGLAVNEIKVWRFEDERDYDKEEASELVEDVYGSGHTPLYADVLEAIREGRAPLIDGREGAKSVAIVLKAYESVKK